MQGELTQPLEIEQPPERKKTGSPRNQLLPNAGGWEPNQDWPEERCVDVAVEDVAMDQGAPGVSPSSVGSLDESFFQFTARTLSCSFPALEEPMENAMKLVGSTVAVLVVSSCIFLAAKALKELVSKVLEQQKKHCLFKGWMAVFICIVVTVPVVWVEAIQKARYDQWSDDAKAVGELEKSSHFHSHAKFHATIIRKFIPVLLAFFTHAVLSSSESKLTKLIQTKIMWAGASAVAVKAVGSLFSFLGFVCIAMVISTATVFLIRCLFPISRRVKVARSMDAMMIKTIATYSARNLSAIFTVLMFVGSDDRRDWKFVARFTGFGVLVAAICGLLLSFVKKWGEKVADEAADAVCRVVPQVGRKRGGFEAGAQPRTARRQAAFRLEASKPCPSVGLLLEALDDSGARLRQLLTDALAGCMFLVLYEVVSLLVKCFSGAPLSYEPSKRQLRPECVVLAIWVGIAFVLVMVNTALQAWHKRRLESVTKGQKMGVEVLVALYTAAYSTVTTFVAVLCWIEATSLNRVLMTIQRNYVQESHAMAAAVFYCLCTFHAAMLSILCLSEHMPETD